MTRLFIERGIPVHIRSDNGSEFTAKRVRSWLARLEVKQLFIEPGSPWENGYAKSFFSRLRDELLNCEAFENLAEARWFAQRRKTEHNEERPHSSLGYQTPLEFASQLAASAPASATPQPALQQPTADPLPQPVLS